tara:strand:+ start:3956 stop:4117 length:162 start_codon:yes stop_codon:yes gene_type:complete
MYDDVLGIPECCGAACLLLTLDRTHKLATANISPIHHDSDIDKLYSKKAAQPK